MWEALCGTRIKQPAALAVLFVLMFIGGCFFVKANQAKEFEKNDYGVFLNADASSLERFKMYETIVIDAQYFTKRDIELLHQMLCMKVRNQIQTELFQVQMFQNNDILHKCLLCKGL